jgi:hypothetical protein
MAHYVICYYCKERFDRDKEPFTAVSARRYAHQKCAEEHNNSLSQEEKDLAKLYEYIKQLLGSDYNAARVTKQIKDYQKDGMSYSGILKTLVYFYEVKGNSKDKANGGIGIVPYVYQDAYKYYYNLYLAQLSNSTKDLSQYKPKEIEITISSPRAKLREVRLFNFDIEEEEDNG